MIDKIEVHSHYAGTEDGEAVYQHTVLIDGHPLPWDTYQVEVPGSRFDEVPTVIITLLARTVTLYHSIDRPLPEPATETPAEAITAKPGPDYTIVEVTDGNFQDLIDWTATPEIWGAGVSEKAFFLDTLHGRKRASIGDWITYTPNQGFNVLTPDEAWTKFRVSKDNK